MSFYRVGGDGAEFIYGWAMWGGRITGGGQRVTRNRMTIEPDGTLVIDGGHDGSDVDGVSGIDMDALA